ncbi:o-succinylbenzoate--CoA ligase [Actinopolyspora saharensis]|uniref:O-succinylbenzoic acid--CoA ligase n=1 Tax=Actinopolyspora saharensis TaxID=995062 RepID=A0A1H1GEA6_9ACTN|nr:o-succinylbenzoate--CoA ligase [Actinopolyspora saharensis]SDR11166.1 O-succinylbenzoic acid--CoA ligase [Actinopolyspora saharensis]
MSSTRKLRPLKIPDGARAPEVLPELRRALDGAGPALLPVPEQDPLAAETAGALGVDEPLAPEEDSPVDPTALVIATSGSTGRPKGVLLSSAALRASARATHHHLGGPGRWLLAMPAHHIAGIQVLIRSLLADRPARAVDSTGGFRPEVFADAAEEVLSVPDRHYTALVPTQLGRLLAPESDPRGLRALRAFDAVLVGGSAIAPSLLDSARRAGVNVVTTYGMSETAGGCVYDGKPLPGVEVHVDTPSPGAISLSGPTLARGYRRSGDDTAFADGWFRTGDLGEWRDGLLDVLGRTDDLIITGGVNVAPAVVERALSEHPLVRETCVLGGPDQEWGQAVLAAVVPAGEAPPLEELRAAVRERAGAACVPKRFAVLDELPRRGPGKPDRTALLDMFAEDGAHDPSAGLSNGSGSPMREDDPHGLSR